MPRSKPHIVVFFGGEEASADLSRETGFWACQYLPRDNFRITPVHVLPDGRWQVPLGGLPQQGPLDRMMKQLFSNLRAISPVEGLQRLLSRPLHGLMSVIRGRGGDDGSLHGVGQTIAVPVIGSPTAACQQTFDKRLCATAVDDIASTPVSLSFPATLSAEIIADEVRDQLVPPLFVKPATQEGSAGTERVTSFDELLAAISRAQLTGSDIVVQEQARGTELTVTLVEGTGGKLTMLSPTVVMPKHATYYDYLAKRRPGRVQLHTQSYDDNPLVVEAEAVARDVFARLGCRGYASFDFVADDETVDLLEVNTVPVLTEATPLKSQLHAAGMHPGAFFNQLIRLSL